MTKPIQAVAFTNHLGYVIRPGDQVVTIAEGRRGYSVRTGTYVGCRIGSTYWNKDQHVLSVSVEVVYEKRRWNRTTNSWENIVTTRLSTLPEKRVYPIDMPLAELKSIR